MLLEDIIRKACNIALHCLGSQFLSVGLLLPGMQDIGASHALSRLKSSPGESAHQSVKLLADAAAVVRQALLPDIPAEQQKNVPLALRVAKQRRSGHHVPGVLQTGDDDVLHDTCFVTGESFKQTG